MAQVHEVLGLETNEPPLDAFRSHEVDRDGLGLSVLDRLEDSISGGFHRASAW